MARKKSTPKVEVSGADKYSVLVKMGDVVVKETGDSLFNAFSKIKMDKIVGKVQLTYSNGKKEWTQFIIRPIMFKRALLNTGVRTILTQRAKQFLGE